MVYIRIHTYIHHTHPSFTHVTALLLHVFMPINVYEEESKRGYLRGLQSIISLEEKKKNVRVWTVAHQAPLSVEFSRQEY